MTDDDGTDVFRGVPWETTVERPYHGDIAIEDLHHLLTSARRRNVISYLMDVPVDSVSFDTLVDIVAAEECPAQGQATHRERIEIDLHHVHLPKLSDAGVIAYNREAKTVQYRQYDALESLLKLSNIIENGERN